MSFTRHRVVCSGLSLFAKVWRAAGSGAAGAAPGKRILAVHGFLDNCATFDLLAPVLAEAGYEVVAMDLPGHGHSEHLGKGGRYHLFDYPGYVLEFASGLNWDSFIFVGHSLGAAIASLTAATFPERVTCCVFIETLGPFIPPTRGATQQLRRAIESRATLRSKQPKLYQTFDAAVESRLAAVTDWPGEQTLSRRAAERLIGGSMDLPGLSGSEAGTGAGAEAGSAVAEPIREDARNWQEPVVPAGGFRLSHDIRLREFWPSFTSEQAVLSILGDVRCHCLLVTGLTGMPMHGDFKARKAAMGTRLKHAALPGSHHLHLDDDTAPGVATAVRGFLGGMASL